MKSKKKIFLVSSIIVSIVLIFISLFIFIYPTVNQEICKNRSVDEIFVKNQDEIAGATVGIVTCTKLESRESYSVNSSGVIFDKIDNIYYCLTAYHVVSDVEGEDRSWLIQTRNIPTRSEYQEQKGTYVSNDEYYSLFYELQVEYYDEECDLAIVSFKCNEELNYLEISSENAVKGENILLVRADGFEIDNWHAGYIQSNKYIDFDAHDGRKNNRVIKHNAYTTPGSSGAAIINRKLEIVGINIGGATDAFGRYKYGVMIPSEDISEFIDNWK